MPELPEVEVTRLGFASRIEGATITDSIWGKPLRWPLGCDPAALVGRRVTGVGRRGKYLLIHLDQGLLLVHLGMSGSLRFADALPAPGPHDHFTLQTTRGQLRLHDPRRFGAVVFARGPDDDIARKLLGKLGVEPLSDEFTPADFVARMQELRAPIKQALLAGEVVVGVGNIYACEALFLAGIRPTTAARAVGARRLARLHASIRAVLTQAVAAGGSTLRDFSGSDGHSGHFQTQASVYGREGQPCVNCGKAVRRLLQGQRSTYYCAGCQAR
jgi:formamidopyrimidine-DNA glycosylase